MRAPSNLLRLDEGVLTQLKEDIAERRIEHGMACLRSREALLETISIRHKNSARFIGYLAQWVDIGFASPSRLRDILRRFDGSLRSKLPLTDYLYFRMAEGMVAMAEQSAEVAIGHFDLLTILGDEWNDKQSLAIVHFWKGRCLRMKGEYDKALSYTVLGKKLATELGHSRMAAVMQVLESWLFFQKGNLREAMAASRAAEASLRETDDHVTLGNIHSFYGRVASKEGKYDEATVYFNRAIEEFKKRDPQHPNLARSLANMALAKREIALQLRGKIDRDAERRRKAGAHRQHRVISEKDYRQHLNELRSEALSHLDQASAIYLCHPNRHGVATIHLNYGYLHLDDGDFDLAEEQSAAAYRLAEEKRDYIIMGRARVLQCMIENAKTDEEISERTDPGSHARRALEFIHEAIELAKRTQNRELSASAYLWQGLTHCNAFFESPEAARESYDLAISFCRGDHPDNMWRDLQVLRSKILQKGSIDQRLKAWSQGSMGDKTFQQISEEFAELIIPRVWEREGRKVSRVASCLSMSPKKVRRILARVGRRKPRKT
jgi:tetratricopeptide (TPR) repeat protein